MNINLYPYQQILYDDIKDKLAKHNKVCVTLATGGGKSVIIGKLAGDLPGRTLILTHRQEILQQNSEWINSAVLSSKENTLRLDTTIVIAMVQTLYARIEAYGIDYIGSFNNIILDEIHVDIFRKVFSQYDYKKLIAFTGTPVLNKKKYYEINGLEYVEPLTLSEDFEVLVCGPSTNDLIELGFLVRDHNLVLELPDFDKLKESESQPDGYTVKSLNEVYSNTASLNILTKAYKDECLGKKTIIFNASNKITLLVYEHFAKLGFNVKMFDSSGNAEINEETGKKYTRNEIIEWFRNERDAILINTNVFTIGFNVTDIECIIVNRATKSLSLWIQMVGRGSRITNVIFKDHFKVIDLGQNIYEHGIWSKDRDWNDYFKSPGPKLKKIIDLLDTWTCIKCEAINLKTELSCTICGASFEIANPEVSAKKFKEGQLVELSPLPIPKGSTIVNYAMSVGEDAAFALNLAETKIIELFVHYRVSAGYYDKRKDEFNNRVREIYRPIYFSITKSKVLPGNKRRKFDTLLDKLIIKINKKMSYGKSK